MPTDRWTDSNGNLAHYVADQSERTLASYREQPNLVTEHANVEQDTAQGGYRNRQLFELVQNSADALWPDPDAELTSDDTSRRRGGRIEVLLTNSDLYCADDGEPISPDGVTALMFSHLSPKRGTSQIGTFGLGFKAVLGVSDSPEFFSRSGSFRFDRKRARERVRDVVPDADRCPILRLPEPIDPAEHSEQYAELRGLMAWANNIVRLPLKDGAREDLLQQMRDLPAEFLLFVPHLKTLTLVDSSTELNRVLELENVDDEYLLAEGDSTSHWKLFERTHALSSDARADRRPGDDRLEVPIWWAAPVDRLDRPGKFWAFFPTNTASLVPGILNAPWKTNEDRQNLLSGPFNDELVGAASDLIADALPQLRADDDPARHLDALPRRHEAGDSEQASLLRELLFEALDGQPIVPDQKGELCRIHDISYPPSRLTPDRGMEMAPFGRWAAYAERPRAWLHHKAITRTRLATIERLLGGTGQSGRTMRRMRRASIASWLRALVLDQVPANAVAASTAAIQAAALIPLEIRSGTELGSIVLSARGGWRSPDPELVFLPDGLPTSSNEFDLESCVHPALVTDGDTLAALKELGLKPPSTESRFRLTAERVLAQRDPSRLDDSLYENFWALARRLSRSLVQDVVREYARWPSNLRVRTRSGDWRPTHSVLLPGDIVPVDGSRDGHVTVDIDFHQRDVELLRELAVVDSPSGDRDMGGEPLFKEYQDQCEKQYRRRDDLPARPWWGYLAFTSTEGVGPLTMLTELSDEGRALFTDALLGQRSFDRCCEMWHTGGNRNSYPKEQFESLTVHAIRVHGRIRASRGIVPFTDALGPQPKCPEALHVLLQHPNSEEIKAAFDLSEPIPEFLGEGEPVPLTDVWPGLAEHLPPHRRTSRLVLCEQILVAGAGRACVTLGSDVYLVGNIDDDARRALKLVAEVLGLGLADFQIQAVLQRKTPAEIEKRRGAIRQLATDAERLLTAVGEASLRLGLPRLLLDVLSNDRETLTGVEIAEAAIATYDTGALRHFKRALDNLDPPATWSGSRRAIEFVRSLGFSEAWAGERNRRRPQFVEVEGPRTLPPLHNFQRRVADNVRKMLRSERSDGTERRGMLSMPTGSGKTRVAVQAIVEAMRDDAFQGGILWVADRDELCEQAVESWEQVWRSVGAEAGQLRISRMWSGQPRPSPTSERHVVVATIQTLHARLTRQPADYDFLREFELAVFDEAHRSIAPTFTAVMQEIGLTFRRKEDEPCLLGLTATPYRGHDEAETDRLVRRYGRNRLDAGAFAHDDPKEVIGELQGMGVLAQADQELIEGGTFRLSDAERDEVLRFVRDPTRLAHQLAWLPQSVEDRIAQDSHRTRRIIEAYETYVGPNWPALIFATSVEHAQTLAALLNQRGVTARSVSGNTETVTRRRVVEGFRRGDVSVLVNYGVFREGFDAPKTRAIIVARPVYSPNLYFQMIGRGLRGPLNGGDERCLVLNVRDNIENFGKELAFSELDWLWNR